MESPSNPPSPPRAATTAVPSRSAPKCTAFRGAPRSVPARHGRSRGARTSMAIDERRGGRPPGGFDLELDQPRAAPRRARRRQRDEMRNAASAARRGCSALPPVEVPLVGGLDRDPHREQRQRRRGRCRVAASATNARLPASPATGLIAISATASTRARYGGAATSRNATPGGAATGAGAVVRRGSAAMYAAAQLSRSVSRRGARRRSQRRGTAGGSRRASRAPARSGRATGTRARSSGRAGQRREEEERPDLPAEIGSGSSCGTDVRDGTALPIDGAIRVAGSGA